jgi:hypothetical protein
LSEPSTYVCEDHAHQQAGRAIVVLNGKTVLV